MPARTGKRGCPDAVVESKIRQLIAQGSLASAVTDALALPHLPHLLHEAVTARVGHWLATGQTRFAVDLIAKVLPRFADDPPRSAELARLLVRCGEFAAARPFAADESVWLGWLADAAVERVAGADAELPDPHRAAVANVVAAFADFHQGRDDDARARLAAIPLGSPLLEWKVALRGLMAWQAGDDARALENWSRLNPARRPAALVAPLRAGIDPAWLAGQPVHRQAELRASADSLLQTKAVQELRAWMEDVREMRASELFSRTAKLIPLLAPVGAGYVDRLLEATAHEILENGDLSHVDRARRKLPPLPGDPTWDRLRALVAEGMGQRQAAARYWEAYEQVVAARPELWGDDTPRVRAIIWTLVARHRHNDKTPAARRAASSPPSSAECLTRALELAPDLEMAHGEAMALAVRDRDALAAITAAERYLAMFPDNEKALNVLANMESPSPGADRRLEYRRRLVELYPLNSRYVESLADLLRDRVLKLVEDEPAAAEAALEELERVTGRRAVELRFALAWGAGGKPDPADLPDFAAEPHRAALMFAYATSVRSSKPARAVCLPAIKAALGARLTFGQLSALARTFKELGAKKLTYHGAKTHAAQFAARATDPVDAGPVGLDDAIAFCRAALEAGWNRAVLSVSQALARRHPADPRFPFLSATALFNEGRADDRTIRQALARAEELLPDALPDTRPPWLTEGIAELRSQLRPDPMSLLDMFRQQGFPF